MTRAAAIKPGELIHRAMLQSQGEVILPSGNTQETWTTVAEIWVKITPLTGAALFYAAQLNAEVDVEIKMRYRTDVLTGMRFLTEQTWYRVMKQPIDVEFRHAVLLVHCSERQVVAS